MTELADTRGHYIAAGNAVLGLGVLALVLTIVAMLAGHAAAAPPGLPGTGALFVVVGAALRYHRGQRT